MDTNVFVCAGRLRVPIEVHGLHDREAARPLWIRHLDSEPRGKPEVLESKNLLNLNDIWLRSGHLEIK